MTHYSAHPAMTEWMRNNSVTERRRRVGIIGRSHIPPSSTCSSYRPLCAISLSERIDEWRNVPCGRVSHSVRNQWPAGFPGTLEGEPNRLGRDHGVVCTCEISNKSKSKSKKKINRPRTWKCVYAPVHPWEIWIPTYFYMTGQFFFFFPFSAD